MKTLDSAIKHLEEYSKANNIYRSEERINILKHINIINAHFTAASLLDKILETEHISRATVYNSIKLFLQAGIIVKHPFGKKEDEYEAVWRAATHHHRICYQCGEVKEFSDKKFQTPIKNRNFNTFQRQYSCVYLYGICKKCQKKNASNQKLNPKPTQNKNTKVNKP